MTTPKSEILAIAVLVLGFAGAPAFSHYYEWRQEAKAEAAARKLGGGPLHVYHLTGIAKPGMWTEDKVEGWNYWWRKPTRFTDIKVNKGDTVLITLTSADVQHSLKIPAIGIGTDSEHPIEVKPGHGTEVSFVANKVGSYPFLCGSVCSCTGTGFACTLHKKQGHEGMTGTITVTEPMGPPDETVTVTLSEDKGFDPPVINAHVGDIVELTVKSQSNGTGSGVGFCISEYEEKVDLQGIASGDSRTFKFKADKAGSFPIYSSTKAGPKIDSANGTLNVSAASGSKP